MFVLVDGITERNVASEVFTVAGEVLVGHDDAVGVLLAFQLGEGRQQIEHHAPGRS